MTASRLYPKQAPKNWDEVAKKRPKLHDFTIMQQCAGKVRSTGLRCRCVAVTGSDFCCKHGGIRNLEKRIQRVGGPEQRKHSTVSLSGQNIKKRLDVGALFVLEPECGILIPKQERFAYSQMGLGARGRKLMEIIAQKDKYKQEEE
jgi:hypothetical protein